MPDDALPPSEPCAADRLTDMAQRRAMPAGPSYAALDLGTNNCRLLMASAAPGGFRVVDSFSRIVRLGEGLVSTGRLSDAAMDRAMAALHACAEKLARRPVRGFHAVATEACRRAPNGPAFLARVEVETGLRLRTISAREEAELAMESCAPLFDPGDRRALLFDIGGGSTEIAWIRIHAQTGAPELIGYISVPVGVVTLSERGGPSCFTEAGFHAVVDEVAERLASFDAIHRIGQEIRAGGVRLMGTSGTVTTIAGVHLGLARYDRRQVDGLWMNNEEISLAIARLQAMTYADRVANGCIGPERADLVLAGCAIFDAIRRAFPADRIRIADRGLREGILMQMMSADRVWSHMRL